MNVAKLIVYAMTVPTVKRKYVSVQNRATTAGKLPVNVTRVQRDIL